MVKTDPDYPHFTVHWKVGNGELISPFIAWTEIEVAAVKPSPMITLHESGELRLNKGYVWDFGSGPAIDTPGMVRASLVHDAFYELMVLGYLPWSYRKPADKLLKRMLREVGVGRMRSQWVYLGVRYGYPLTQLFGSKPKEIKSDD